MNLQTLRRLQSTPGHRPDWDRELARMIDHTRLVPQSTFRQIEQLCQEAMDYHFAAVCIHPTWVSPAVEMLADSGIPVCTVIGFPLGANTTHTKRSETSEALRHGAHEIDMVMNIGAFKSGEFAGVRADMRAVVEECHGVALVKVIIETALLTDAEKVQACEIAVAAGADFVKTSTGFAAAGATADDVALLRRTVGWNVGVKAAGGIRDRATALAMVRAGATRIGASASVEIVSHVPEPIIEP